MGRFRGLLILVRDWGLSRVEIESQLCGEF